MKIKISFCAFLILTFVCVNYAQIVKITPKKIVYKRTAKDAREYKKTFTVTYPKVSGLNAALNKKIENAISYERVFDFKLKEEIAEIFWLEHADFKTEYNRSGVLVVALTMDGSGAYPSIYTKHVVVDTKTGLQVKSADVFIAGKTNRLVKMLDGELQKTMRQAIAEAGKQNAEDGKELTEILGERKFVAEELNHFSVNNRGVTFYYDYGFPHVALALEPNGEFFLPFSKLREFIKRDGLLGRFVRKSRE